MQEDLQKAAEIQVRFTISIPVFSKKKKRKLGKRTQIWDSFISEC
jgi:hypothetical protein